MNLIDERDGLDETSSKFSIGRSLARILKHAIFDDTDWGITVTDAHAIWTDCQAAAASVLPVDGWDRYLPEILK